MNSRLLLPSFIALAMLGAASVALAAPKVGVYDSRLVAYAHFFQPSRQAQLKQLITDAKAAQAAGDTTRFSQLEKKLVADQREMHLQVFSTAPIAETLAAMHDRVVEIEREAEVVRLVSKWDEDALRAVAPADRVDVTELLLRGCVLSDQQRQTIRELAATQPLPLTKARELAAAGKP